MEIHFDVSNDHRLPRFSQGFYLVIHSFLGYSSCQQEDIQHWIKKTRISSHFLTNFKQHFERGKCCLWCTSPPLYYLYYLPVLWTTKYSMPHENSITIYWHALSGICGICRELSLSSEYYHSILFHRFITIVWVNSAASPLWYLNFSERTLIFKN